MRWISCRIEASDLLPLEEATYPASLVRFSAAAPGRFFEHFNLDPSTLSDRWGELFKKLHVRTPGSFVFSAKTTKKYNGIPQEEAG